jgi:hypothetical protein
MASKRQIEANRRNAQKSTGPKTPEGRAAVRYNALRHGLTAQHAVLSDEEDEEFQEIVTAFQDDYRPVGPAETLLVQQMSMAAWRLQRIRGMETGLLDLRLWHFKANMRDGYTNPLEPNQRHAYYYCVIKNKNIVYCFCERDIESARLTAETSCGLSGSPGASRKARRSNRSFEGVLHRAAAPRRAQEHRADGGAVGSRECATDAPVSASFGGPCRVE